MRALLPDVSGFVDRDGVRVSYDVYGDANSPTVVLLPTWAIAELIFEEPNRLKVISFHDKPSAMEAGRVLAEKLQTRLLDYTSDEPVWMDNIIETAEN